MSESDALTREEQEKGIAVVRSWPAADIRFVAELPAKERDTILLLAALLEIRPA
jgi:hypothetical protein